MNKKTLTRWAHEQHTLLTRFESWWRENAATEPDDYLMRMESGKWDSEFAIYLEYLNSKEIEQ